MIRAERSRLPEPGPEPAFSFPGPARTRLGNGLSLWTLQRGAIPLVTIVASLPAGSWCDPLDHPGLSSMTADMLDEGTGDWSAIEIQEVLARLGADFEVDAGHDSVTLSMTILQRNLGAGLDLLAGMVARPRLAEFDVERLRTLRLNRLRQMRDAPAALAERAFADALYAGHPYAHLPFGSSASIERLSRARIAEFHRSAYRAATTTIIVVGPMREDDVRPLVERAFETWDDRGGAAAIAEPAVDGTTFDPRRARVVIVDRPGAAQTELRIGHVAVSRQTPDFHALLVLNAVLGGQFVSRINLNLRERRGYTYGARTAFEFRRHPGPFSLATSVQTESTADAVAESLAEVAAIRDARPVTDDELAMARQTLTLGYPRNFESTGQIARALAQLVVHDLPDDTFATYAPRVRAQTTASVTDAARRHLDPARLTIVAVGDLARIRPGLQALGLGEVREMEPSL